MKIKFNRRRKWFLGVILLLVTATPSFALFGFGDIVFDPTSYASLVSQLTTLQTQYTLLKNNIEHFSLKQQWQTTLTALKNVNVANLLGETNGMTTAFNSNSPTASSTAWMAATVPMSSDLSSFLQGQSIGSPQRSQLAMIEMSDSISPDCITAVGQYRAARLQNTAAISSLNTNQLDGSTATNSEVQQLNMLNAAEAQKLSEMQNQGSLQACLASQMAVANMERRNAAGADLNTAVFVETQHATHDMSAAGEDNTCPDGAHMLRLINTKLLLAILAALAVIATVAVYQLNETAKSAAILRQQQREAERRRQEDESFRKSVDAEKKRHDVSAGNEGKTWTHYIP